MNFIQINTKKLMEKNVDKFKWSIKPVNRLQTRDEKKILKRQHGEQPY